MRVNIFKWETWRNLKKKSRCVEHTRIFDIFLRSGTMKSNHICSPRQKIFSPCASTQKYTRAASPKWFNNAGLARARTHVHTFRRISREARSRICRIFNAGGLTRCEPMKAARSGIGYFLSISCSFSHRPTYTPRVYVERARQSANESKISAQLAERA